LFVDRRSFVLGAAASLLVPRVGLARGRTPIGGRLSLRVPWPMSAIDPHKLEDATAAIFGDALFDTLYARDESGAFAPQLAEADPEPDGASLRVKLRSGLKTGKGRPFEPRDAAAAIARARTMGARAWLVDVPAPRVDGRSLVFAMRDSARLVRALASPIVAMVPSAFAPEAPEGTGPFRWVPRGDAIVLARNPFAARGPAYLEEVTVRSAAAKESLRAFESGTDDLGWHGLGLHEDRKDAERFDSGAVGWAVLYTGRDANDWDAPGVAQTVCDGIDASRLKEFNLGPEWPPSGGQGWGGPPTAIVVRDDCPWLGDLARAVATLITRPSHEVTVKPVPASDLAQRRVARMYGLALDVVRPLVPGGFGATVALATADGAGRASDLVQHPPKVAESSARAMTRLLRCGVVGELRVQGGRMPQTQLVSSPTGLGFDLGASWRRK
jgi:peptide/nickel transport system substrate-binding protein